MKYAVMFVTYLKNTMAYRTDTLLGALFSFFRVLLCFLLWKMLIPEGGTLNGFTLEEMVTYSVLTTALAPMINGAQPVNVFADDIRTGKFVRHLTAPVQPFFVFISHALAVGLPPLISTALCCCVWGAVFSGVMAPISLMGLIAALPILMCAVIFMLLLNYLTACLAFRFTEIHGIVMVRDTLLEFFSGSLAPLEVLFGGAPLWSPLYYLTGYPVLLMLGKAQGSPLQAFGTLLVWTLFIGIACAWVSQSSRRLFEGVGA